jgi:pimeloyl-ACP methyl ester carboxylesterase
MQRRDILISVAALATGAAAPAPAPAKAAPRRSVSVRAADGVGLFHSDWGEGAPVLFASSWGTPSDMWAYQVAHLSERGFRCIGYDRRGHGRSDRTSRGYEMDVLADDMAAVIDQLDLHGVTLVGHSMGCAEAIRYLARHGSARVKKVVLIAPAAPCLVQTADNPYGAPRAAFDARMAEWRTDFPNWVAANREPFFTPQTSPAMEDWLIDQMLAIPLPVILASFQALIAADLRPDLARIDRPTLILQGTKDASIPLEISGQRLAAGISGAQLKVYPGAPHGLFVTHMEQVNADLEAFLRA